MTQPTLGTRTAAHLPHWNGKSARPAPTHISPALYDGTINRNPKNVSLLRLLAEDVLTHETVLDTGLWAVALHRIGNARMDLPRACRLPVSAFYNAGAAALRILTGVELNYTIPVGRRVRLWHASSMVIGARSIGDDVQLRQNTTLGIKHRGDLTGKPTLGDRVEIGANAVLLGNITVGDDAVIGAGSVVTKDVPAGSVWVGNPARQIR